MEYDSIEEAKRAAVFQAAGRDVAVVKRGEKFAIIEVSQVTPQDTVLGHTSFVPDN